MGLCRGGFWVRGSATAPKTKKNTAKILPVILIFRSENTKRVYSYDFCIYIQLFLVDLWPQRRTASASTERRSPPAFGMCECFIQSIHLFVDQIQRSLNFRSNLPLVCRTKGLTSRAAWSFESRVFKRSTRSHSFSISLALRTGNSVSNLSTSYEYSYASHSWRI